MIQECDQSQGSPGVTWRYLEAKAKYPKDTDLWRRPPFLQLKRRAALNNKAQSDANILPLPGGFGLINMKLFITVAISTAGFIVHF